MSGKNQTVIIFEKKVNELITKAENLKDAEVAKVIRLLSDARKEVAATVASTEWQIYRIPEMKNAIDRALQQFGDRYGVDLREAQRIAWENGIEMVDAPLRQIGVYAAFPAIDTMVLTELQKFSKSLVDNLGRDAAAKIYNEITMGLLGQKTPFEVMEAVGINLKDKSIFTSIAARAETITRTEAGRALEAASQARLSAAAGVVPGLQKQWAHREHSKNPRVTHLMAHGQIRDVDKPFDIGGKQLMFPGDPAAGPGETINCGCFTLPYHENWGLSLPSIWAG